MLCNNNYYMDVYDALCFCSSVVLHAVSLQEMNRHLYTHFIVWLYEYILLYVMDTRVIVMGLCYSDNISMHKYYVDYIENLWMCFVFIYISSLWDRAPKEQHRMHSLFKGVLLYTKRIVCSKMCMGKTSSIDVW